MSALTKDEKRERIIIDHMDYVQIIVRTYPVAKLLEWEEAVSEGYVALIEACDGYKDDRGAKLKTFIAFIVRRHIYEYIKAQKIKWRRSPGNLYPIDLPTRVSFDTLGFEQIDVNSYDAFLKFESWDETRYKIKVLKHQIKLLNRLERRLMDDRFFKGLKLREIAEQLDMEVKEVSRRIIITRKLIIQRVERDGWLLRS